MHACDMTMALDPMELRLSGLSLHGSVFHPEGLARTLSPGVRTCVHRPGPTPLRALRRPGVTQARHRIGPNPTPSRVGSSRLAPSGANLVKAFPVPGSVAQHRAAPVSWDGRLARHGGLPHESGVD